MPKGYPVPAGTVCSVPLCGEPHHASSYCAKHYKRWKRHGDPLGGGSYVGTPLVERVLSRLSTPDVGCWEWQGPLNSAGYGYVRAEGRIWRSHRVMYEHFVGPIPAGLDLDHLCRNRRCARPDHLEAVTHQENMRRGYWGTKSHCVNGHAFAGDNLQYDHKGHRICRQCVQDRQSCRPRLGKPEGLRCEMCGRSFEAQRRSARFCSKACSWRSWDLRRRGAA